MAISDPSDEARCVQDEVYRSMTPAQRVELAIEMSEELRSITIAGIRARQPGIGDKQLLYELLVVLHGRPLADRVVAAGEPRQREGSAVSSSCNPAPQADRRPPRPHHC